MDIDPIYEIKGFKRKNFYHLYLREKIEGISKWKKDS